MSSDALSRPLIQSTELQKTTIRRLLSLWRVSELLSAGFGVIGWIVATIDYEARYSSERDHQNCLQNDFSDALRWLDVVLTLAALLFLALRHVTKREWNLEKLRRKQANSRKALKQHSFLHFLSRLLLESLVLCLFPYPDTDSNMYVDERHLDGYRTVRSDLCYTSSEILYVLMLLRFFFVMRAAVNMTQFMDGHSKKICSWYGVKANLRFATRALVKAQPFWMMVIFVLPSALLASVAIRVFERPYVDIWGQDFAYYPNVVWFTYVTMTTIGYGDYVTATQLGRLVAILIGVWGLFVFSMMIYIIDNTFQMSKSQTKSFQAIKQKRKAAQLIQGFLIYRQIRQHHSPNHPLSQSAWEHVVQLGISFRKAVLRPMQQKALKAAAKQSMLGKLQELEALLDNVSDKAAALEALERQLQMLLSMLKALSIYHFGYVVQ